MAWEFGLFDALTKTVSFVLLGTSYKMPLWEMSVLLGIVAFAVSVIFARGVPISNTFFSMWKRSFFRNVITAPILEEIIFRLVALTLLTSLTGSVIMGIFLSALLFGLLHMHWGAYRVLDTFLGGLLLGLAFTNWGLLSAIIIHMTHNFFTFAMGGI